jgi:hypothetical protein
MDKYSRIGSELKTEEIVNLRLNDISKDDQSKFTKSEKDFIEKIIKFGYKFTKVDYWCERCHKSYPNLFHRDFENCAFFVGKIWTEMADFVGEDWYEVLNRIKSLNYVPIEVIKTHTHRMVLKALNTETNENFVLKLINTHEESGYTTERVLYKKP